MHMLASVVRVFSLTVRFFGEVRTELKKVNWLERREVINYTIMVFAVSFVVAVYLGALDYFFTWALRQFVL